MQERAVRFVAIAAVARSLAILHILWPGAGGLHSINVIAD